MMCGLSCIHPPKMPARARAVVGSAAPHSSNSMAPRGDLRVSWLRFRSSCSPLLSYFVLFFFVEDCFPPPYYYVVLFAPFALPLPSARSLSCAPLGNTCVWLAPYDLSRPYSFLASSKAPSNWALFSLHEEIEICFPYDEAHRGVDCYQA